MPSWWIPKSEVTQRQRSNYEKAVALLQENGQPQLKLTRWIRDTLDREARAIIKKFQPLN